MNPGRKIDQPEQSPASAAEGTRKSWVPKSPVEVILEQIQKQEKKVSALEAELNTEKTMLTKLLQAKKVLEST